MLTSCEMLSVGDTKTLLETTEVWTSDVSIINAEVEAGSSVVRGTEKNEEV